MLRHRDFRLLWPAGLAGGEEDVPRTGGSLLAELREGFEEVRSRSWVWVTLLAVSATLFLGPAPWFVLAPIVAEAQYGGTDIYGVVSAALGAGTIIGATAGIR